MLELKIEIKEAHEHHSRADEEKVGSYFSTCLDWRRGWPAAVSFPALPPGARASLPKTQNDSSQLISFHFGGTPSSLSAGLPALEFCAKQSKFRLIEAASKQLVLVGKFSPTVSTYTPLGQRRREPEAESRKSPWRNEKYLLAPQKSVVVPHTNRRT